MLLTADELTAFDRDGFLLRRGAFTAEQMECVSRVARADPEVAEARGVSAKQIKLWSDVDDASVYSAVAQQRGIVEPVSEMLGGVGVEHYHHKLIMKEQDSVSTGVSTGTWEWHQVSDCGCAASPWPASPPVFCMQREARRVWLTRRVCPCLARRARTMVTGTAATCSLG